MTDFIYHGEYISDYTHAYRQAHPDATGYAVRVEYPAGEEEEPDLLGVAHALIGGDSTREEFNRQYVNKGFTILRVTAKEQAVFPNQLALGAYLCVYRHDFNWYFYLLSSDFVRSMAANSFSSHKFRRDFPELFQEVTE
jgi:hypothetical protein